MGQFIPPGTGSKFRADDMPALEEIHRVVLYAACCFLPAEDRAASAHGRNENSSEPIAQIRFWYTGFLCGRLNS